MTRHAAIYARLSPRPDGTYDGIDTQTRAGRRYAARTWPGTPVKVFADKGISAANGDHRPGFEALREALARGEIAHLWTVEQSRLERTERGWFALAAELDAAGIREVHTDRDHVVDVLGEVSGIKSVLAAAEVRRIRGRVNARLADNAATGRPPGGVVFGYRHVVGVDGRPALDIDPVQAEIVRECAARVLAGWSLSRIAADLAKRGVTGARGGRVTGYAVKGLLRAPTVAAHRVYGGRDLGPGSGNWPPILDEHTWHAVRDRLAAPRIVTLTSGAAYPVPAPRRAPAARRYLLTGTAVCGVCSAPLVGTEKQMRNGKKPHLLCHRTKGGRGCVGILAEPVEAYVVATLLDELDKPAFRQAMAEDAHAARRDEITMALRAAEGTRSQIMGERVRGEITTDEWRTARAELDAQEAALRAELAEMPPPVTNVDPALIREGWEAMNLDEQREIIGMFIERVVIRRATPGATGFDPRRVAIGWRTR
ncbi:MAG TPA: recombinase family protein [Kribbellaceae bacterium]